MLFPLIPTSLFIPENSFSGSQRIGGRILFLAVSSSSRNSARSLAPVLLSAAFASTSAKHAANYCKKGGRIHGTHGRRLRTQEPKSQQTDHTIDSTEMVDGVYSLRGLSYYQIFPLVP